MGIELTKANIAKSAPNANPGITASQRRVGGGTAVVINAEARIDLEVSSEATTQIFRSGNDET